MIFLDINTKNRATGQFSGLNYNSMCKFAGKYIAASTEGLHLIGGADDNGVAISASIKTGEVDLDLDNPKRFRFVYFGLETTGDLILYVYVDEVLVKTVNVIGNATGKQQRIKVPIPRKNASGRYLSWELQNVNGSDFSIDSVKGNITILSQGKS